MKKVLNQVLLNPKSRVGANLEQWLSGWGGDGLSIAIDQPGNIISMIKEAGLPGLGGSGFPTYIKWQAIADQDSADKYLICNGNEDEPGTFKDRILLEETPFQVIEGATIVALACNINHVIFYINPHLETCLEEMNNALSQWLSSDFYKKINVPIEYSIIPSNGHYIAGE